MRGNRSILLAALVVGAAACGFSAPESAGITDGGPGPGDPPTLAFGEPASTQDETSGAFLVPVRLSAAAATTISVPYTIAGGTATAGDDYEGEAGTLVFEPGELEQGIALEILDDEEEEPDETITLELGTPRGGEVVRGQATHTVTISANVLPRVAFMVEASGDDEAGATVTLEVVRENPSEPAALAQALAVPFTVAGTATRPADHALTSGTLTIPAGEAAASIELAISQDDLDEDNETVVVTLGSGPNYVVGTRPVRTHTILDEDAPPAASFMTTTSSQSEGDATVTATVRLAQISGRAVTIPLVPATGTAELTADFDYPSTLSVTIPAGATTATTTIAVKEDLVDEDDETVVLALGASTTADTTDASPYTLTIVDDDAAPLVAWDPLEANINRNETNTAPVQFRAVMVGATERTVTITITLSGSATVNSDYTIDTTTLTFPPGTLTRTVQVALINDTTREDAEVITMTMTAATNATLSPIGPLVRTLTINASDQ